MKFLFLLTVCFHLSEIANDEIRWNSNRKLAYADFKGAIPAVTPWAATTNSKIFFSYETINGKISKLNVYASFDTNRSWMKKKLPEVLSHEQLHFDITEYYARRFYEEVMKMQDEKDPKEKLNALFQKINFECDQMQQKYDDETQHGTVADAQTNWKKKVNDLIESTQTYPQD